MTDRKKLSFGSVRATLISVAIACVAIRVIWWAIWPMIVAIFPYVMVGILLITVIGIALRRTTRL